MMYERLAVARDLLKDDGVIFMSIDDNEVHNLRKIADEIFGEENFITEFVWKKTENIKMDSKFISINKDYILCYRKGKVEKFNKILSTIDRYNLKDNQGMYYLRRLDGKNGYTKGLDYVIDYNGLKYYPGGSFEKWKVRQEGGAVEKDPRWLWSKNKFEIGLKNNDIIFKKGKVYNKVRYDGIAKKPYIDFIKTVSGQTSQKELNTLFNNERIFDHPKPNQLVELFIKMIKDNKNDIILDFFSGSATTAHAVMQSNAEDGGEKKFIMVQLAEKTNEKSEAFKSGYKNISEIGIERIKRAGKKILEENADKLKEREIPLDIGFRVYKTDSSNMKDVYYNPSELEQSNLLDVIDNVKEDRSPEDLLTQVMLDLGLTLDLSIEEKKIKDNKVFFVEGNSLVACFDKNIDFEIVDEITKCEPLKVVFKDSCFKDDKDRINVENRFKRLSPETIVSVI